MPNRRRLALAVAAALCAGACATAPAPLSQRAAGMPVFSAGEASPAVAEVMGAVKTDVCLSPVTGAALDGEARNDLRRRAEAKGADALVGYHYRVLAGSPRAVQCQRIVEAEAEAVMLNGATAPVRAAGPS
jgi:hypothetical protein